MFLDDLSSELISLKQEKIIIQDRISSIEGEIIILIGEKEEGATTVNTDTYKVTTTGKLTRKLDVSKLVEIKNQLPDGVMDKVISIEPKLNLAELRKLDEVTMSVFSRALTVSPAKTAVTVKEI